MKIAIGMPAYNEEKNIAALIAKLQKSSYSVIVCNDGSTDMTGTIAEQMGAIVINHKQNLGYGAAIRSLFDKAREFAFDVLVTFDADGQHNSEDIPQVIEPLRNGEADIVIGSRFQGKEKTIMPKYRELGIKAITKLASISADNKIKDAQSGFRGYSKKVLQNIYPLESGMGVSTEILLKASKNNFKIVEVPITVDYEGETSTHHPVSHGFSVVLSTMKFISIDHPLKFYGIPGLSFLAIGLFFIVWTLQAFSETRIIITNLALIGTSSTILGIILLVTAIMLFSMVIVVREKRSGD